MQKNPAVTIGIPFYNAEATLLDAVRSVFAQTHKDWQLILLDDGSTDGSLRLARSIKDPRVSVYSDGKNRRLGARLNQMTKLAKYDFIARMDADDLMSPIRLERQLELLVSRPEADFVSTGVCSLSDDAQPVGIRGPAVDHSITARGLLSGNSGIVHASIVGRRAWFERNPYKENLGRSEDANLWVRAFSKKDLSVIFMTDAYYFYREDQSVSRSKLLMAYKEARRTILEDARNEFLFSDRVIELSRSFVKSGSVAFLSAMGRLDYVRNRRNKIGIDSSLKLKLVREIEEIQRLSLPFFSS